jgi:hypothetical protein
VLDSLAGAFDVLGGGTGQAANDALGDFGGDGTDRFEVAGGRDGKAGLDDVDAERFELTGHFQLFLEVKGGAG